MKNLKLKMKDGESSEGLGSGGLGAGNAPSVQASKLQHPEKFQAPRGAHAWAEGDLAKKHEITKRTHFKNAGIA